MIFTYNLQDEKIVIPQKTSFKTHNILERKNIEKWIEEYPEILGEELLILTSEFDKFDKTSERLDLLALDREGILVVIELKRDDTGKVAEFQAIKYAAYCSTLTFDQVIDLHYDYAKKKGKQVSKDEIKRKLIDFIENAEFEEIGDRPRIILLAKEYRAEVTASVIWLRKFGIDISCIKITPYIHDGTLLTIESSILIPIPDAKDFLVQVEKKEISESSHSLSKQEYLEFFTDLVSKLGDKIPNSYPKPMSRNYYSISSGLNNVHYEWIFRGRPRNSFCVELHFENSDKSLNQRLLAQLASLQEILEKKTGETVIITKDWGKNWARISIEKKTGEMSKELREWAVEKMITFFELFQPEIDKLKTSQQ